MTREVYILTFMLANQEPKKKLEEVYFHMADSLLEFFFFLQSVARGP